MDEDVDDTDAADDELDRFDEIDELEGLRRRGGGGRWVCTFCGGLRCG